MTYFHEIIYAIFPLFKILKAVIYNSVNGWVLCIKLSSTTTSSSVCFPPPFPLTVETFLLKTYLLVSIASGYLFFPVSLCSTYKKEPLDHLVRLAVL